MEHILSIGDIHGNFNKAEKFLNYRPEIKHLFLGDLVDSFDIPFKTQIKCLKLILSTDPENVILIAGNHCLHYLHPDRRPFKCSGYQEKHHKSYEKLYEKNQERMKAVYCDGNILYSHAGIAEKFINRKLSVQENADKINKIYEKSIWNSTGVYKKHAIFDCGNVRGGSAKVGGIFWYDFKQEDSLSDICFQIFGHTEVEHPVIDDSYAAIDTTNDVFDIYVFDNEQMSIININ